MQVRASSRYIRIAPRKIRQVARMVEGFGVDDALSILKFTSKAGARVIYKLLTAAKANAVAKGGFNIDELSLKNAIVNEGPSLKRVKPRARGRRDIFKKRTSHVVVIIDDGNEDSGVEE